MADAPAADNLAWIDLEMTGLDPARDVILQAALVVTNAELTPLTSLALDIWQPEAALQQMTPFVRDMHERTGLLARIGTCRTDVRDAERQLLACVSRHCTYPATLCGNTVGMDKRFMDQYMPALAGFFHYRVLDVSSLKIVAQRYYGSEVQFRKPNGREHDALFDIENSIAEFAHYREHLLRPRS